MKRRSLWSLSKRRNLFAQLVFISILISGPVASLAQTQPPADATSTDQNATTTDIWAKKTQLESLIDQKSQALDAINKKLQETHQNLQSTQQEKASLQRELSNLQNNINQLELNIQSDQITSQKLGLEVDSLTYDIRDIELTVVSKNDAIGEILREMQKVDQTTPLITFLKNDTLADAFLETQSLRNLRAQLAVDITNLASLHDQMNDKIKLVTDMKGEIELHQQNLQARKSIAQDQKEVRNVILNQTKSKESVYEQQLAELRQQQNDISDEISQYEDELRKTFDVSLLPVKRPGVFSWPVLLTVDGGIGYITQHFGEISALYRGKPHNGLDIGVPIGTPIKAADDGIVMAVDNNDRSQWSKYQYGKYVLIKHNNSLATLYAHLSRQAVTVGQKVKRGDIIGYSGQTGYATGPHLHFGAYWAPSIQMRSIPPAAGLVPIGVVINPEDYL